MMGANEDEGATFFAGVISEHPELWKQLNENWNSIAPLAFDYGKFPLASYQIQEITDKIRQFYFGSLSQPISLERNRINLTNLYSDQLIIHSVHKAAMEMAKRGNKNSPVYLYQYAYWGPVPVLGTIFGLTGDELKSMLMLHIAPAL